MSRCIAGGVVCLALSIAGCASSPPAAPPSTDLTALVEDAARGFESVRGERDTTLARGYGAMADAVHVFRSPLAPDSAREAVVTVTHRHDGRTTAAYEAVFGQPVSAAPDAESRRAVRQSNEATLAALAALAEAETGWTRTRETRWAARLEECPDRLGRFIEIETEDEGTAWTLGTGDGPCLSPADLDLLEASLREGAEAVRRALDAGADPNRIGSGDVGALGYAVRRGKEEMIRLLLARGASPDGVPGVLWPPLLDAPTASVAQLLLDAGAAPDTAGWNGVTPVHAAAMAGDADRIRVLAEAGADLDRPAPRQHDGKTALHFAISSSDEAVRALLEAGADPDAQDANGTTPLVYTAWSGPDVEFDGDPVVTARLLLAHGADPNLATDLGRTPLMEAVSSHHAAFVRFLVDEVEGVDLSARQRGGLTALGLARREGHGEIAAILEGAGAPE